MVHLKYVSLICILTAAAVMDIRCYRVKNRWIFFGLVLGIVLYMAEGQWMTIFDRNAGLLLPGLLLVLYRYSMLGAADIKLFAVAGFYLGFRENLLFIIFTFTSASVPAVYRMIKNHNFKKRFFYFLSFLRDFSSDETQMYMDFLNKDKTACIHMTVPMAAAAVILYIQALA